ncbi:hypothetical protein NKJ74_25830 [Mesorhizobium sp. M0046]|uniref:hypothetical protein n=1 Tax=Mesorhizobium sp. M0046 TaxID=2956858 RepID=UPI00333C6EA6
MLADVVTGQKTFSAILVLNVRRWGRFPDADQSAHYEFLCRDAGVAVKCCGEQFENDCESACKIGSDSISLHVKAEVAIFPRGNQRDGTEIWVDETGAGGLRRRACGDRHGLRIS